MYTIIDKFSDTTLFASDENGNCILKVYLPEEKPVYDKLMTVRDANIANITGYTEIEGIPYVVSEFISGISIGEYVHDNGCMPDEMIRHIAQGICNGLSVVHSSGIVHRDITPENVIIDENGNARIIDFGISRVYDTGKTKDTEIMGTAGFAAPEQFGFHQTTEKADIYSLGALINYMAEGELPSEKLTQGTFRNIVMKCTRMDEDKRYRNAGEVSAALESRMSLRRLESYIPGFSGSKKKKILSSLYYIYIIAACIVSYGLPGHISACISTIVFFIAIPFIVSDSTGLIRKVCKRQGYSKKTVLGIKVFLIFCDAALLYLGHYTIS